MRGDRPLGPTRFREFRRATPHARGSTFCILVDLIRPIGYPACAGIDPSLLFKPCSVQGLPRMRGDRPPARPRVILPFEATPHARGSTADSACYQPLKQGYPACAGIDPSKKQEEKQVSRLPRMRGDRPYGTFGMMRKWWATPHARGSTW